MTTIVLTAPDISCEHCQKAIEGAVGGLEGVTQVSVDISTKAVTVVFDESKVTQDAIEAVLDDEGYPVSK